MVNVTNCGSYTWAQNGITYNASGQYLDTASNSVGCDSVITLNLTINNSSTGTETVTACNSYTSPSGNYNWTASGTYLDTILNSTGCDSVITTTLIINTATSSVQTVMSCDNYYWTVNNQTYIVSGSYMDTTINALGCDSIITLNLTINNSYASTVTQTACNTYTWPLNGVTYTISGNYSDTMVAVTGCDFIITLNLQINSSDSVVENVISCGSYLWSTTGNLYTTSGSFQAMLSNTYGCDSVVTLNLVITLPSTDTIPMIVCDSYQWVLNGNTYTMSGFYIDSLTSVSGCDSLIILDLTVNNSSAGTLTENSCGVYTAPDGSLYTTSGQYTVIIPNSTGCDSVITVNLTVTNIDTTVTQQGFELTAVDTGYSYQWLDCENAMSPIVGATSVSFIPSVNGSYAVEITDGVCLETSSCHKVTGVGVEEILLSGIIVYPNPVYDELKVINERQLSLEIRVLDLTGKQVGFRKTNAERTALDLSDLPSGVYLIQIKSDGLFMTKKVTVR
jgi:energy-converting hydrogenase Eha subunit C